MRSVQVAICCGWSGGNGPIQEVIWPLHLKVLCFIPPISSRYNNAEDTYYFNDHYLQFSDNSKLGNSRSRSRRGAMAQKAMEDNSIISKYYNENKQTSEIFAKKMNLRNALWKIFEDVFPCELTCSVLFVCRVLQHRIRF